MVEQEQALGVFMKELLEGFLANPMTSHHSIVALILESSALDSV